MLPSICAYLRISFSSLMLLLLAGCAATSVWKPYPETINPQIESIKSSQFQYALQDLDQYRTKQDKVLYLVERARIAQIAEDYETSRSDLETVIDIMKQREQAAVVSGRKVGAQAASLLTNENAIPYELAGFEKIMVYNTQALNFLFLRQIEAAGVEVRRANSEQNEALRRHEQEIEEARQDAEEKKLDLSKYSDKVDDAYHVMDDIAGRVKNSFQNAYTFYVSGIIYELLGMDNDAYIDYKKALEIYSDNTFLQADVLRLASKLHMSSDLQIFTQRFGKPDRSGNSPDKGDLVILFENGFVPQKQEIKISLPTENGWIAVAFPIYDISWYAPKSVKVYIDSNFKATTELICDVRALAVKSLKEKAPALALRQALRITAKAVLQKQASDKMGFLGCMATSIYNIASESADLRGWYTLPNDAQIFRTSIPSGMHNVRIVDEGTGYSKDVDVQINSGRMTVIKVVSAGPNIYTSTIVF
ncbi:hypothetical protein JW979_16430 [bacterium]|nr:hypothetical protein [candidate division CSSED10-310 bacterium]